MEKPALVRIWVMPATRDRIKVRAAKNRRKIYEEADALSRT